MKQVILVRTDLGMRKGKIAAQVAHASVNNVVNILHSSGTIDSDVFNWKIWFHNWMGTGYRKIVLKCPTEKELFDYYYKAKKMNIPISLI